MSTRTRPASTGTLSTDGGLDLDQYSEDELNDLLFTEPAKESKASTFNLPALMGYATLLVGVLYLIGSFGAGIAGLLGGAAPRLDGLVVPTLVAAALTIFGTGTGMFSRGKRKKVTKVRTRAAEGIQVKTATGEKKRLAKSRNRKIAGVAAGIAEYFGIDPTIVRVGMVIGTLFTSGWLILVYAILAAVLPRPEPITLEERIRIIRDS